MLINEKRLLKRIEAIAMHSEKTSGVTRLAFTMESKGALAAIEEWMKEAGMSVRYDEMCNIIGHYPGENESRPIIMMGSHVDSVREGGKYDGILGILAGIEVVQVLNENGVKLSAPLEVIGFCDEEGARFGTTLLGSKAIAGILEEESLNMKDDEGISVRQAVAAVGGKPDHYMKAKYPDGSVDCYLEVHIEQGPVLEKTGVPCGIVTGIAGQSRYTFTVTGHAGHAGTVPISMRQDALAAASELILEIEKLAKIHSPLVATVGQLMVKPGSSNVIPGSVRGSLDVRDVDEKNKLTYLMKLFAGAEEIMTKRNVSIDFQSNLNIPVTACSERVIKTIEKAIVEYGGAPVFLQSGAGHDGMAISKLTDIGMIFVRCKDGLSHHPDEYCSSEDMAAGAQILFDVINELAR